MPSTPSLYRLLITLSVVLSLSTQVSARETAGDETRLTTVTLAGKTYRVEIAHTREQRARGLMYRRQMPADHGMLFLFPQPRRMAFWMKNTKIPLDILFFDTRQHLVRAHYRVPPCIAPPCAHYPSGSAATWVLELNGGVAEALKLTPGSRLQLVGPALLPVPE
jgi:uncharacterized membrane protein (UPF0127 family)